MRVYFSVQFKGGYGTVVIKIFRKGKEAAEPLVWDGEGGDKWRELEPGFHTLAVTGNASSRGTDLTIHKPTNPQTPDSFPAGPITKGYTMTLKDEK